MERISTYVAGVGIEENTKKYYSGIDLTKFIMSLVVVAIHTGLLESVRGGNRI